MFYVYHLIDPRSNLPFYIGKGTGQRAWSHLKESDVINVYKSNKINEIRSSGLEPLVTIVSDKLDEQSAFQLEIEEIKKYGRKNIDQGGILTNLLPGGTGGDTSSCFTQDSLQRISENARGVNNPNSKLNEQQVISIFRSCESTKVLANQYGISNAAVCAIKRGYSYTHLTEPLNEYPGYNPLSRHRFLTPAMVKEIYMFSGTSEEIKDKFGVSVTVARNIKFHHMYFDATKDLDDPGGIKIYNLSWDDVCDIRASILSAKELADLYAVDRQTIYNIRNYKTRKYD
jgi:hypothetical protein